MNITQEIVEVANTVIREVEDMKEGNGVDKLSVIEEKLNLLMEMVGELKDGQDELSERMSELTLNYGSGMTVESYDN